MGDLDLRRAILYLGGGGYMLYLAYRIISNPEVEASVRMPMNVVGIIFGICGLAAIGFGVWLTGIFKKK